MANYSGEGPVCHVCPAKGMLPGRNVVSASFVRPTLFSPDEMLSRPRNRQYASILQNRNDLLRFRKKSQQFVTCAIEIISGTLHSRHGRSVTVNFYANGEFQNHIIRRAR